MFLKYFYIILKKTASIFFLIIYLFSTTEAIQLLKLPVIFQHYAEHQLEDRSISFFEFLDIHYMHGSPKDKDYDKDMKLPFKTPSDYISAVTMAVVPQTFSLSFIKPIAIVDQKNFIILNQCVASAYLANIWQPPKSS
jgi:hypothetical protein